MSGRTGGLWKNVLVLPCSVELCSHLSQRSGMLLGCSPCVVGDLFQLWGLSCWRWWQLWHGTSPAAPLLVLALRLLAGGPRVAVDGHGAAGVGGFGARLALAQEELTLRSREGFTAGLSLPCHLYLDDLVVGGIVLRVQ